MVGGLGNVLDNLKRFTVCRKGKASLVFMVIVLLGLFFYLGSANAKVELNQKKVDYEEIVDEIDSMESERADLEDLLEEEEEKLVSKEDEVTEMMTLVDSKKEIEEELSDLSDELESTESELEDSQASLAEKEKELEGLENATVQKEEDNEPEKVKEEEEEKPKEKTKEKAKEESESSETVSQQNAVGAAEDYLSFMAFSKTGLIEQLEFDGFDNEEAAYAVDQIDVNWKEQAVDSATKRPRMVLMGLAYKRNKCGVFPTLLLFT